MWRRLLILDLALAATLVYGSLRIRQDWQHFNATHRVEAVEAEKESVRTLPPSGAPGTAPADWTDISVRNPFSFDRNDIAIVAPKTQGPRQPKPVLFGTMSIDNQWIAMLGPGQGANRGSRSFKVGDSIDDWQVVEINDKSVVVTGQNGERQTVNLSDARSQVPPDYSKTSTAAAPTSPTILSPAAEGPSTQPTTAPVNPAAQAPATAPAATGQPAQPKMLITPFGIIPKTDPQ